jgi:2-dehydro-3-deoxyphosphogluconate aldolase/(4S)-4-hydroxy-2-oxoglutarate aldolase
MMQPQTAYDHVARTGLMAGMRGHFAPDVALAVTEVLFDAGIAAFEFTMNSVQPLEAMQAVKRALGDSAACGMGTVLDAEMAGRVLDTGADFIVAPTLNHGVREKAQAANVLWVPGVITPTEAQDAYAGGAKLVKIFPIGTLGVEYFKAVRGPLDHIPFICNGGMSDKNVGEFLRAGAVACGMANWLTGDGTWALETIRQRAQRLVDIVAETRGEPVGVRV